MDERSADGRGAARKRPVRRVVNAALLGLLITVMAPLRLASVGRSTEDAVVLWGHEFPSTCIHRALTGRRCPGCGLTRSVVLAFDGRLADARAMHPSGVWVAAWLVGQTVVRLATVIFSRRFQVPWVLDLCVSLATLWLAIYLPILPLLFPG